MHLQLVTLGRNGDVVTTCKAEKLFYLSVLSKTSLIRESRVGRRSGSWLIYSRLLVAQWSKWLSRMVMKWSTLIFGWIAMSTTLHLSRAPRYFMQKFAISSPWYVQRTNSAHTCWRCRSLSTPYVANSFSQHSLASLTSIRLYWIWALQVDKMMLHAWTTFTW